MTDHVHENLMDFSPTELMGHLVTTHTDIPVDDVYTAVRGNGLRLLHESHHPEGRPATVTFKWYLHYDETSGLEDYLADPPPRAEYGPFPAALAREIAEAKPFYEVTVTVEYDTATKKFTLIEAKL